MPLIEYEFDQGFTSFTSSVTTSSLDFTNLGVEFTWSVQSDTPVGIGHFPGVSDGIFDGIVSATTATGNATFVLGANTPGQNIFSRTEPGLTSFDGHIQFFQVQGKWTVQFVATASGTDQTFTVGTSALTTPTGSAFLTSFNASFNPIGKFTEIRFTTSASTAQKLIAIDELNTDMSCFCAGTRIATPEGHKLVEDLVEGDRVLTAGGGLTTVRWLGLQFVDTRRLHPVAANPVRICKGALGAGLPQRDLLVSGDHGIGIDGYLINAAALVNGTTIQQLAKMPVEGFTYYHVETDTHELILAEGVAAESYLDMPNRDSFDNGHERDGAPMIEEMALPRISSARLIPQQLTEKLRARAEVGALNTLPEVA